MTDYKIEFTPTEKQAAELEEAKADSHEAYFKLRSKMEAEFQENVKKIINSEVEKKINSQNAKDYKDVFTKFKKEHPKLNFDENYLKENLPQALVKQFEDKKISADAYLMKAVGYLNMMSKDDNSKNEGKKADSSDGGADSTENSEAGDSTETGEESGSKKDDPNLNEAAGGSNPGQITTDPNDTSDEGAFGA